MTTNKDIKERIYLSKDELQEITTRLSINMHIIRYVFSRQYVKGNVLDIACGCGYGSYLLTQRNPDISQVVGVDESKDAVEHANKHFKSEKVDFINSTIEDFNYDKQFDYGVSIETIEHLKKPEKLVDLFNRNKTKKLILTFPTIKSTHFNPYHLHDFKLDDIKKLFLPNYEVYDTYEYDRQFMYVFLKSKF